MERSLYPEAVEVRQVDLARTESTKIENILGRHQDISTLGVLNGLEVIPNSGDATLIDIAAGSGYVPNGELVTIESVITAQQLATYTNDALNYVIAFYTETNNKLKAHETNGESFATEANASFRLRVLTQAEFDALSATDDNLSNDALDRGLILTIVSANGAGIAITTSDITLPSTFNSAVQVINSTNNITGVSIVTIDRTVSTGTGELDFTTTPDIRWKAPGEVAFGAPVNIAVTGTFTLTSSGGKTLTISVVASALPGSDQLDTLIITNIYDQNVDRFTPVDVQHRGLLGGGVPTVNNPHGLIPEDLGISSGVVETHQDLFHSNGILRTSASDLLEPGINPGPSPDLLQVISPIVGDSFYLNGIEHNAIVSNAVSFVDVSDNKQSLWNIYVVEGVDLTASLEKRRIIDYDTAPPPALALVAQLSDIDPNTVVGVAQIKFDNASDSIQYKSPGDAFGTLVPVPDSGDDTVRLFSDNGVNWIDIFARDFSSNWGSVDGGDVTEDLNIFDTFVGPPAEGQPSTIQKEARLLLGTVMYSGISTGFLGNGDPSSAYSPNSLLDKRLFGITGVDDLRDDARTFLPTVPIGPFLSQTIYTTKSVSIGEQFPPTDSMLYVKGNTSQSAIRGVGDDSYGIIAESKISAPQKAALRMVPQDADPSVPLKGDVFSRGAGGKLKLYNGSIWSNISHMDKSLIVDSSEIANTAVETPFDENYVIPANLLQSSDILTIKSFLYILQKTGVDTIKIGVDMNGGTLIQTNIDLVTAPASYLLLECNIVWRTVGVTSSGTTFGTVAAVLGDGSVGTIYGDARVANFSVDTTAAITLEVTADWSAADPTNRIVMKSLNVSVN